MAKNGETGNYNTPTIAVSMTHQETVVALASYFGCGCVHYIDAMPEKNRKAQWKWTVRWNDARAVCKAIEPFAITKMDAIRAVISLPKQRSGPRRRFSDVEVRAIRGARLSAPSYAALGRQYGIGAMTAWKIVNRQMYADVA